MVSRKLRIAIVGCGTAGLAAAAYLKEEGHDPEIFEKFNEPRPIGSGLLLQPTGLACLATLGLDECAIASGAVINNLYGATTDHKVIFDIKYSDLRPHCFGLGIHRGTLFQILYEKVTSLDVPIHTSRKITGTKMRSGMREIFDDQGTRLGPFDLVVDASGMRSPLRKEGAERYSKRYPYGAVWGVVDDPNQTFGGDCLQQRYRDANIMIGMLAIGKEPDNPDDKCAFFWSLPANGYDDWRDRGMSPWKQEVISYWPEMEPFVDQFESADDLTFATYCDVIMHQWYGDRIVFIGDAAHNTSPQLGQGANLALADAYILTKMLNDHRDVNLALYNYARLRKSHIRFYQTASRYLTPFFQSDSKFLARVRNLSFGILCKTPLIKMEMLRTLAGLKTGLLCHMNPGEWNSKYDIDVDQSQNKKAR